MKKTVAIVVAIAMFIASLSTNIYYFLDNDAQTVPNVEEVVNKGKDVYNAIKSGEDTELNVGVQE